MFMQFYGTNICLDFELIQKRKKSFFNISFAFVVNGISEN